MTWFLRIGTPQGVYLYELGEAEDPTPLVEDRRADILAEQQVPVDWIDTPGWDVSLVDDPHPSLLAASGASSSKPVTGLTPGSTYNVATERKMRRAT